MIMTIPDEINVMIADIEKRERYLSGFESFLFGYYKRNITYGQSLTERQHERLVAMWERIKCAPTST